MNKAFRVFYIFYFLIFNYIINSTEIFPIENEIREKDILLDDNPLYNTQKKNSEESLKLQEEYEDTEFSIPEREISLKKRNLTPEDTNKTIERFESKEKASMKKFRENSFSIYGGYGNFIGGNILFSKILNHGSKADDFRFSLFSLKAKDESYDFFESRGKYILDSKKTKNQYELKGFTYFSENFKLSYNVTRQNSILYLQDNPIFQKQKKNLNRAEFLIDYIQSDKLIHKIKSDLYEFKLDDDSRFISPSNTNTDKKSEFKKRSLGYEAGYDLNNNWKICTTLSSSVYSGKNTQLYKSFNSSDLPEKKEGRFQGGFSKKESGSLLRGFIFKSFWNFHFLQNDKNFYGGEINLGYRLKDYLISLNYEKSGQLVNFLETYIQNDLSDLNLQLRRTEIQKAYTSLKYEIPNLRFHLKAGNAFEYGKYFFYQTKEFLYRPEQKDIGYDFFSLELNLPIGENFQIGAEGSCRNYDRDDLPYLPKIVQTAYVRLNYSKLSLELKGQYMSNMNTNKIGKKISDQRRLDFLFYYAIFGKLDFRLEIRNIEDRELFFRENFYYPGRQILFGMRMNL
ncbi:MAG: hypothetical protein L6Q54_10825 [Leptospiraceae bacterium]|nr:hypothetical protein [Leptospiraceae bacterium]MCK6381721.1 hypothetical protein [Leptospiraceae bacterium]NUM42047.1 hypothetical protein [Leptospiraceae bacterium]